MFPSEANARGRVLSLASTVSENFAVRTTPAASSTRQVSFTAGADAGGVPDSTRVARSNDSPAGSPPSSAYV